MRKTKANVRLLLLRLNTIERKIDDVKHYLAGTDYFHVISDVHYKISNLITDFEEEHKVRTNANGDVVSYEDDQD